MSQKCNSTPLPKSQKNHLFCLFPNVAPPLLPHVRNLMRRRSRLRLRRPRGKLRNASTLSRTPLRWGRKGRRGETTPLEGEPFPWGASGSGSGSGAPTPSGGEKPRPLVGGESAPLWSSTWVGSQTSQAQASLTASLTAPPFFFTRHTFHFFLQITDILNHRHFKSPTYCSSDASPHSGAQFVELPPLGLRRSWRDPVPTRMGSQKKT